jgi:hypothetical protein
MAQTASRAGKWWSGAGSNCRPSAFQKVCRARCHRVSIDQSAQLERIHPGSWADTTILTPVPRCAGECRFVRVARVLDASWTRTCVALVLVAAAPVSRRACTRTRPRHAGTRASPRLPAPAISHPMPAVARLPAAAGLPAIPLPPSPRPGMTHRDEQSMLPANQKHPYRRIGAHITSDSLVGTDGHNCCSGAAGARGLV